MTQTKTFRFFRRFQNENLGRFIETNRKNVLARKHLYIRYDKRQSRVFKT